MSAARLVPLLALLSMPLPALANEQPVADGPAVEEPSEWAWGFNLSGIIGGGTITPSGTSGVFSIGFRPEVFFPRVDGWPGIGLYLEVGSTGGLYYGSGLSVTIPLVGNLHVAPSVGVAGWEYGGLTQLSGVASLFVGNRMFNPITAFDATFGIRFDARYGADDGLWSFTANLAFDLTILAAVFAFA